MVYTFLLQFFVQSRIPPCTQDISCNRYRTYVLLTHGPREDLLLDDGGGIIEMFVELWTLNMIFALLNHLCLYTITLNCPFFSLQNESSCSNFFNEPHRLEFGNRCIDLTSYTLTDILELQIQLKIQLATANIDTNRQIKIP